jgi:hypothetical protein
MASFLTNYMQLGSRGLPEQQMLSGTAPEKYVSLKNSNHFQSPNSLFSDEDPA